MPQRTQGFIKKHRQKCRHLSVHRHGPPPLRTFLLTSLTMLAFAANSLLCRAALVEPAMDGFSFTAVRLVSGAATLWLIVALRRAPTAAKESALPWRNALALFGYALPFSLAYLALDAGVGALILFGGVQVTMIVGGVVRGERPRAQQWLGLLLAAGGLVYLVSPGVSAPDPLGAALMTLAGVSWGVYSLLGKGVADATRATQRNFLYAAPLGLIALGLAWSQLQLSAEGVALAVASGALASGVGYALWYTALGGLTATTAAVVQLSVPVIAAIGGVLLLGEAMTARLAVASTVILGGIAVAVVSARDAGSAASAKSDQAQ